MTKLEDPIQAGKAETLSKVLAVLDRREEAVRITLEEKRAEMTGIEGQLEEIRTLRQLLKFHERRPDTVV